MPNFIQAFLSMIACLQSQVHDDLKLYSIFAEGFVTFGI